MNDKPKSTPYLVIQEGSSSGEHYCFLFDTPEDANAFRKSCRDDGSYRTSEPVPIPDGFAEEQEALIIEFVERCLAAWDNVDYPEDE